jgi:hypothetical protein
MELSAAGTGMAQRFRDVYKYVIPELEIRINIKFLKNYDYKKKKCSNGNTLSKRELMG